MPSPQQAPGYSPYRTVKAADSAPYANSKKGLNCAEYATINIQLVIPSGDSVTAKFFSWCDADSKFIPIVDGNTYGPYTASTEISFPANGRILFVELKGTVTDTKIYASASPFA